MAAGAALGVVKQIQALADGPPTPEMRDCLGQVVASLLFFLDHPDSRVRMNAVQVPDDARELPVSNTIGCVVVLVIQYFGLHALVSGAQILRRLGQKVEDEERALRHASHALFFSPMLCVVFLGVRMRAVQLARGQHPDRFNLPPWWLKSSEVICVASCVLLAVVSLIGAMLWDDWEGAEGKTRSGLPFAGKVLLLIKKLFMVFIYVSFVIICFAACAMQPPEDLWQAEQGPEVSPALVCTLFLACLYVTTYVGQAVAKVVNDYGCLGQTSRFSRPIMVLQAAASTLTLVPMVSVLFLTVRLQAMQTDPVNGNPQRWLQECIYACSACVALQTLLAFFTSFMHPEIDVSAVPKLAELEDSRIALVEGIRLVLMAGMYTWIGAIVLGVWILEPASDPKNTRELPAALNCILALATLFFGVYTLLWLGYNFCFEHAAEGVRLGSKATQEAVEFCPMVSVVILSTLVRALQLSHGFGAPQDYCQAAFSAATTATVLLAVVQIGSRAPFAPEKLCTALQYAFLSILYISIAVVMHGFMRMTPHNALGAGSIEHLGRWLSGGVT